MKRISTVMFFMATSMLWAQNKGVIPWVANNDSAWRATLVINNHDSAAAGFTLKAVRTTGQSEEVGPITLDAGGHWSADAGATFPSLGSGSGYAVFIDATTANYSSAVSVASTGSASGNSPGLASGVALAQSANRLVLPYMADATNNFAGPVVVNMADGETTVTIKAFTAAGEFTGNQVQRTLAANTPFTDLMTNLFPGLTDSAYLEITAEAPLAAVGFGFNLNKEPSILNAIPSSTFDSGDLDPLLVTMETATTVATELTAAETASFGEKALKEGCPELSLDYNPGTGNPLLAFTADWGSGCTNEITGVWHAGSLALALNRSGTVSAGWMAGDAEFNQFQTTYQNNAFAIDGNIHVEASSLSRNFILSGSLTGEAVLPTYQIDENLSMSFDLTIVAQNLSQYIAYGSFYAESQSSQYASILAKVSASDPLVFNFATCPWPTNGTVEMTIFYGTPVSATLDFDTGNCFTAIVTVAGQSQEIPL